MSLHLLVPVKRVIDHHVTVRVKRDGSGVETQGIKMSMNPFDEVALEQALRLREQGLASRVSIVACGAPLHQDVLRTGLAMGADAAFLIDTTGLSSAGLTTGSAADPDPLAIAQLLAAFVAREQIGLVLCGKQAIDDDLGATAPMLAALLDWPQAISVNQLALADGQLQVSCDADQGLEQLSLPLPAVLSVDLRLCDPRSITLPNMMRAKKAAITTLAAAELVAPAALAAPRTPQLHVADPAARAPGVRVADLAALIAHLQGLAALQPA